MHHDAGEEIRGRQARNALHRGRFGSWWHTCARPGIVSATPNRPAEKQNGNMNLLLAIVLILVGIGVLVILFRASD